MAEAARRKLLEQQLIGMDIPLNDAIFALEQTKYVSIEIAMEFIFNRPAVQPSTGVQSSSMTNVPGEVVASTQLAHPKPVQLPPPLPNHEDVELQRVLEESKKVTHISDIDANTIPPLISDDMELERALQMSMQPGSIAAQAQPVDPNDMVRLPDVPVGMLNVGNTCYFSSLIQTYFRLRPSFVAAVLAWRLPDAPPPLVNAAPVPQLPAQNEQNPDSSSPDMMIVVGSGSESTQPHAVEPASVPSDPAQLLLQIAQHAVQQAMAEPSNAAEPVAVDQTMTDVSVTPPVPTSAEVTASDADVVVAAPQVAAATAAPTLSLLGGAVSQSLLGGDFSQTAMIGPQLPPGYQAPAPSSVETVIRPAGEQRIRLAVAFMSELQKLFAEMQLTAKRWVDPTACVRALFDFAGQSANDRQQQQDVTEFNTLILDALEVAFEAASPASASGSAAVSAPSGKEFMFNQFQCRSESIIEAREPDGALVRQVTQDESGQVIVGVESGELHASINELVDAVVDYRTPTAQVAIQAPRRSWYTHLPRTLCVQLQRVVWRDGKAIKSNRTFQFPSRVLHMDRYASANAAEVMRRREMIATERARIAELQGSLDRLTNYEGMQVSLPVALRAAALFARQHKSNSGINDAALDQWAADADQQSLQLNESITAARLRIQTAFDDMRDPRFAYALRAVLIHDGPSAGKGHYWCYVRSPCGSVARVADVDPQWLKFNDRVVTRVPESEVMEYSTGGKGDASAYFLVYTAEDSDFDSLDSDIQVSVDQYFRSKLPNNVLVECELRDALFAHDLEQWRQKQVLTQVGAKFSAFMTAFSNAFHSAASAPKYDPLVPDDCISDLGVYLARLFQRSQENAVQAAAMQYIFQRALLATFPGTFMVNDLAALQSPCQVQSGDVTARDIVALLDLLGVQHQLAKNVRRAEQARGLQSLPIVDFLSQYLVSIGIPVVTDMQFLCNILEGSICISRDLSTRLSILHNNQTLLKLVMFPHRYGHVVSHPCLLPIEVGDSDIVRAADLQNQIDIHLNALIEQFHVFMEQNRLLEAGVRMLAASGPPAFQYSFEAIQYLGRSLAIGDSVISHLHSLNPKIVNAFANSRADREGLAYMRLALACLAKRCVTELDRPGQPVETYQEAARGLLHVSALLGTAALCRGQFFDSHREQMYSIFSRWQETEDAPCNVVADELQQAFSAYLGIDPSTATSWSDVAGGDFAHVVMKNYPIPPHNLAAMMNESVLGVRRTYDRALLNRCGVPLPPDDQVSNHQSVEAMLL